MPPLVDVCIATYRRPEGLRRLLRSLREQETEGRFTFAIRVADNDSGESAGPVVRELEAEGLPISYAVEPVQSISLARNRSLSLAAGDWVATIDDDLWAGRRWLLELLAAAEAHGADVVHGRSLRQYLPGTPFYVREFHDRPAPETGATTGYIRSTGNALFRRSLIEGMQGPFDPKFGRTGGEDTDFFNRLEQRGCRMVFCREALVDSLVPAERSTLRWCLQRRFRTGTNAADIHGRPLTLRSLLRPAAAMGALAILTGVYSVAGIVYPPLWKLALSRGVRLLLYGAWMAGRFARHANYRFEEYADRQRRLVAGNRGQ